ncbi:mobile genetic element [Streptococcus pneumoniae]|nr:mobile genetic element [Streptococcus pneumoniae]VKA26878.1 mobile genetic element [Streptococcus pneumoniae]VKJ00821.1 mobile genetic element [Streptococcus pneumoniae]VKN74979.1 mobile genetic element [Streptococcus pneumoniae]VNW79685.1 mobile genetic element [Streptococcus pneumoniae]
MISRIKSSLKLISFNRLPAKQNYEASKQLTDTRFKRLVGVQRTTFEEMLAGLKTAYQLKHSKGGRKPKLSLEDLLMATLQYVREYRTYEQIAADFGIHESNLLRRSQWVEVTLVQRWCYDFKNSSQF